MNTDTIIVCTPSSALCFFEEADARTIVSQLIDTAISGRHALALRIEHRQSSDVRQFLDSPVLEHLKAFEGGKTAAAPAAAKKHRAEKKKAVAKPAGPAAARTAPGGKKTNKQIVLDFLAGIDRDSACDMRDICARTGLPGSTVSPILSALRNAADVGVVVGGKFLRFYGIAQVAAKPLAKKAVAAGSKVTCAARDGRSITIDSCVPNADSGACRRCEHVADGGA